jgi:hypothetical protein
VDEITHEITLYSDLTEERRERLLDIANRCPVHRTARTCLTTEPYERVPLVSRRTTSKIDTILRRPTPHCQEKDHD